MIDIGAIQRFVEQVRRDLSEPLVAAGARFLNSSTLVRQFEDAASLAIADPEAQLRQLHEKVNELCVAMEILGSLPSHVVQYEAALSQTRQTIDFVAIAPTDERVYFDVKTVHPEWQDTKEAQERYERQLAYVPNNVNLMAQGATYHQMVGARAKFLEHAIGLERKVATFPPTEQGFVRIVFCGDGFSWNPDELEDFADFYLTGSHRADDPFARMEQHYLEQKKIVLDRAINEFCYLIRPKTASRPAEARCGVRGPHFGRIGA